MHKLLQSIKSNLDTQSSIAQWISALSFTNRFYPVSGKKSSRMQPFAQRAKRGRDTLDVRNQESCPPQDIGSILMIQTPIYFLCPIHLLPILYIPIEFSLSVASGASFNISAETKSDISNLLRSSTAHIVSFVNWFRPLEALSHYFLYGQLLSLVFSENLQLFILSSHLILPKVL